MIGRNAFIDDVMESLHSMITSFEDREIVDGDFSVPRELAEELYAELDSLREE